MPVEKSGQEEFEFEHADFDKHIEEFKPTYAKVLVRFNPENAEMNKRQIAKLKNLDDYCKRAKQKYIFELLVPATETQLKACESKEDYDLNLRPKLMVQAMAELQTAGINPDVWKLEGVDKTGDALAIVARAQAGGRNAGIITLGRGESIDKVREWLKVGAKISGIIGFAVGRTIFWEAMEGMHAGKLTEAEAIALVARNYLAFAELWRKERNG